MDIDHYNKCIANGCSQSVAEMLAEGKFPAIRTDTAFSAKFTTLADQFKTNRGALRKLAKNYRKATGKQLQYTHVFNPTIARSPDDHLAVSAPHEVRSHARRVAADRGCGMTNADGDVLLKPREPENAPRTNYMPLADDLVDREFTKLAEANPEITKLPDAEKQQVRERIIDKHGSHFKE